MAEEKSVKDHLKGLEKVFGKGSVMQLGDAPIQEIEAISTRSMAIDDAIGIGGFPKGRIIEIYGPESSGKTTLTLHTIAELQSKGGTAAFVDAEHAFDPVYASNLGIDVDNLVFSQPDNGEEALEIVDKLLDIPQIELIVVDSVAALTPKAELEGEMGDNQMGLQARLMSKGLRKITGRAKNKGVCVIFINQLRSKIGVMFGNPETTTGGNALKFYASVRVDIRRSSQIKDGDEVLGNRTKVKIVKNKVAPPFRRAEFDIMYGTGIDTEGEILDFAVEYEVAKKSGSWYSYDGTKIAQGRTGAVKILKDNPELCEELKAKVYEQVETQK